MSADTPTTASAVDATDTETNSLLIATNKVDGFKVTTRDGQSLGLVHQLMLDKQRGAATYAVLALGGFLGLGKSYYPVPFDLLSYDALNDVYVVTIDKRMLEGGPSWASNPPVFDQTYADRVSNYYGRPTVAVSR